MNNAELSDLIGIVYDCALEPERWPEALAGIARATQSANGFIVFHDLENNLGSRFFEHGLDERWLATYFESFAALNPIPAVSILRPVGDVHALSTLFEPAEWRASAFYQGWVRPQALGDMMGLLALRSGLRAGWLALQRWADQPDYGAADLELLGLLSPHICRSLRIADVLDLRTITSQVLDRTLEGLSAGVVLLDRDGRIVHANAAAKRLIAVGTAVRAAGGRLLPVDRGAQVAFSHALTLKPDARLSEQPGPSSIALPDPNGAGLLATVLPLDRGQRRHILAPFAAAHAVFVQDASAAPSLPIAAFATLYRLTRAEQRFLAVLLAGTQVSEASAMLGVAESTGKTHLKHLFEKTGTNKQTELLKLVMSSTPPVR